MPGVVYDNHPFGHDFGDCVLQPPTHAGVGDVVTVKFVSGHPRNDLMLESSFLFVERLNSDNSWKVLFTDADWETKFSWSRTNFLLGESEVTIEWTIPGDVESGSYRIRHQGYSKTMIEKTPYSGKTRPFQVNATASFGHEPMVFEETGLMYDLKAFVSNQLQLMHYYFQ